MPKNIILCFDGTKENFGPQPYTNVLKIYRLLDTTNQICYYQPGIGTAATFDSIDDLQRYFTLTAVKNTLDAMFAFCLDDHITSLSTWKQSLPKESHRVNTIEKTLKLDLYIIISTKYHFKLLN